MYKENSWFLLLQILFSADIERKWNIIKYLYQVRKTAKFWIWKKIKFGWYYGHIRRTYCRLFNIKVEIKEPVQD